MKCLNCFLKLKIAMFFFLCFKNCCFNDMLMSFSKLALSHWCSFAISAFLEGKMGVRMKIAKNMIVQGQFCSI